MKLLGYILSVSMLLVSLDASAQSAKSAKSHAVKIEVEHTSNNDIVYKAINKDYCHYHVILKYEESNGYIALETNPVQKNIVPGESTIAKRIRSRSESSSHPGRYNYRYYRGRSVNKINSQFVYALPIKTGDSIRFMPATPKDNYTIPFQTKSTNDTVYAVRNGIVCDNDLIEYDGKAKPLYKYIMVYHKDFSFCQYIIMTDDIKAHMLVKPGENIKMGQPIAILRKDESDTLGISILYLDDEKVKDDKYRYKYSHIIPIFQTLNSGSIKLKSQTTYIAAAVTDSMQMQDMSKKEIKKFQKKQKRSH